MYVVDMVHLENNLKLYQITFHLVVYLTLLSSMDAINANVVKLFRDLSYRRRLSFGKTKYRHRLQQPSSPSLNMLTM